MKHFLLSLSLFSFMAKAADAPMIVTKSRIQERYEKLREENKDKLAAELATLQIKREDDNEKVGEKLSYMLVMAGGISGAAVAHGWNSSINKRHKKSGCKTWLAIERLGALGTGILSYGTAIGGAAVEFTLLTGLDNEHPKYRSILDTIKEIPKFAKIRHEDQNYVLIWDDFKKQYAVRVIEIEELNKLIAQEDAERQKWIEAEIARAEKESQEKKAIEADKAERTIEIKPDSSGKKVDDLDFDLPDSLKPKQ